MFLALFQIKNNTPKFSIIQKKPKFFFYSHTANIGGVKTKLDFGFSKLQGKLLPRCLLCYCISKKKKKLSIACWTFQIKLIHPPFCLFLLCDQAEP